VNHDEAARLLEPDFPERTLCRVPAALYDGVKNKALTDQSLYTRFLSMNGKKEQILQSALRLFAAEGLAVPTAKIAKEAGVANGTLFNYFPTKQDLIDTLYLSLKKELTHLFLTGGADKAKSLKERSFVVWNSYIRWAITNPLKPKAMNQFRSSNVLSVRVLAKADDIFKPFYEMVQKGIDRGELLKLDVHYLYKIKAAQIGVCIDQALERNLKGKALEAHILSGFDIYWKGVTA
jgi:AcrR family transcriptional regulator